MTSAIRALEGQWQAAVAVGADPAREQVAADRLRAARRVAQLRRSTRRLALAALWSCK